MSEIDDIFASKGKTKAAVSKPSSSGPSLKKEKKRKRTLSTSAPPAKPVETIVDTSSLPPPSKRPKAGKKLEATKEKPSAKKEKGKEDEERFKDSRGTGPRRKTEEGWSIYKVDELGIDEESGETPLCPFDCECCF